MTRRYEAAHVAALLGTTASPGQLQPDDPLVRQLIEQTADDPDPAPDAVRLAARALADLLATKAPGRSVEVRIPGPGGLAFQCVEGPRHTRGTPPNVVELPDAHTWVRLAAGRISWEEAQPSASGERADLTPYLPVL